MCAETHKQVRKQACVVRRIAVQRGTVRCSVMWYGVVWRLRTIYVRRLDHAAELVTHLYNSFVLTRT